MNPSPVIITCVTRILRRSEHGQVLINMSCALLCLYVVFLAAGYTTPVPAMCGFSAALVHYFMLVYFMWTLAEAVYLYIKLVKVLGNNVSRFPLKAGLISWCEFYLISINKYIGPPVLDFSGATWHSGYISWSWLPLLLQSQLVRYHDL